VLMEKEANFRSDQSGRPRHEDDLFGCHPTITTRLEEM
jgi:hypothetical protein